MSGVDIFGVAGAIPKKSARTYTPTTTDQTISSGQYLDGAQTIKGDANLLPENIVSGKSIFGVEGSAAGADQNFKLIHELGNAEVPNLQYVITYKDSSGRTQTTSVVMRYNSETANMHVSGPIQSIRVEYWPYG